MQVRRSGGLSRDAGYRHLRSNDRKPDTMGNTVDTSFAANAMAVSIPRVATVLALRCFLLWAMPFSVVSFILDPSVKNSGSGICQAAETKSPDYFGTYSKMKLLSFIRTLTVGTGIYRFGP